MMLGRRSEESGPAAIIGRGLRGHHNTAAPTEGRLRDPGLQSAGLSEDGVFAVMSGPQ
jgi:hypothetical protein